MSVEIVRVTYDDVMRIADEFSCALLDIWQEQKVRDDFLAKYGRVDTFALHHSEQEAHRQALAEISEESERYWGIIRQKGEALYQMAAQYGAGREFLERFVVGLNLSELNTASFKLLEASAKSIRAGAFQRKNTTPIQADDCSPASNGKLSPCHTNAYKAYELASTQTGESKPDGLYKWLEMHGGPDDYDLPNRNTWKRYLREYDRLTDGRRLSPSAGKGTRNVVPIADTQKRRG